MSTAAGLLTAQRPEQVAVVIPAKDEAERIEATVRAAASIHRVDMVVVVDDGSSDATAAIARGAGALVVRHRTNQGKAAAMATGARVVAMREDTDRATGGESFREELHAEPRTPGHTGPLPVIDPTGGVPRALLFLDADMEDSAAQAQPLVIAVLDDGVDMAIALLPPQAGAAGFGVVVRTARSGIRRATGWEPEQPLSGTRCITREAWDACQPLAPGWGVETSLSIDALAEGFWVKEIPCDLQHRATGKDLSGQLHRAAQLRDVTRALLRRRSVRPPELEVAEAPLETEEHAVQPLSVDVEEAVAELALEEVAAHEPAAVEPAAIEPADAESTDAVTEDEDDDRQWTVVSADATSSTPGSDSPTPDAAAPAWSDLASLSDDALAARLSGLPLTMDLSDEDLDAFRALGADLDVDALDRGLRALPVDGLFDPDEIVVLAGIDLTALARRLRLAPVRESFSPQNAMIIGSHLGRPAPTVPDRIALPMTADEYTSFVVQAAVDAADAEESAGL